MVTVGPTMSTQQWSCSCENASSLCKANKMPVSIWRTFVVKLHENYFRKYTGVYWRVFYSEKLKSSRVIRKVFYSKTRMHSDTQLDSLVFLHNIAEQNVNFSRWISNMDVIMFLVSQVVRYAILETFHGKVDLETRNNWESIYYFMRFGEKILFTVAITGSTQESSWNWCVGSKKKKTQPDLLE